MFSARLIPRLIAVALVLSAVLAFSSNVHAAETPKKPAEPAAAAAPQTNSSAAVDPIGKIEPPDGVWLKDEEGREYYVDRIPKDEGFYRRIDDKTVKTRWGVVVHVDHEDDKSFYYRLYRPMEVPLSVPPPPTAEQLAAARQSYQFETKESDRLTFQAFSSGLPQRGQWRNGFDLADMNGDGTLDIVHGSARKTRSVPQVFLHDGKGSWSDWDADFPPLAYDYGDAVAGDLNGDGRNDIVLGVHLHGILVLLNEGRGKFKPWGEGVDFRVPSSGVEPVFSSRAVALADWNRDGKLDIIAFGEGPRLATDRSAPAPANSSGLVIYLNQGDGHWVRKDQGTDGYQLFGDHLLVSDIDGDGHPDALTTSNTFGRTDILNLSRADGGWQNYDLTSARRSGFVRGLASGDFDGDGKTDLALGFINRELGVWRSGVDVLLARPEGQWERRSVFNVENRDGVTALAAGDLDGDHQLDLVALTGKGEYWVFVNEGKGAFSRLTTAPAALAGECRGYDVKVADLDRDGRSEIVAEFAGEGSPLLAPGECPSQGAITAWKLQPNSPK